MQIASDEVTACNRAIKTAVAAASLTVLGVSKEHNERLYMKVSF